MRGFRAALGGLTVRGRSFLAAGVAAVACALVLGEVQLLRVGMLLAALPLLCAAALLRSRFTVAGGRRMTPGRVHAGQEARVHLRVDNVSRLPSGTLLLEDRVPYVLGARPRFVLDRVEPRGHREVTYRVRSDLRGRYRLGPLQLHLADPFGMCELSRSFSASDVLTVVPAVEPLPPVRLRGEHGTAGDGRTRSVAAAGEDDVIPRGYRHGDDIRRVHWRSTARRGELMVRREEQPSRRRCTLLLDTRAAAHRGGGPASSFEWGVAAAASLSVHLLERGYAVRMVTDGGVALPDRDGGAGPGSATAGLLLDALAVLEPSDGTGLVREQEALRVRDGGLLVAVVGELADGEAARLAALRGRGGGAVALLVDAAAWGGGQPDEAAERRTAAQAAVLREGGWTVLPVRPGDRLAELWRGADRHAPARPTGQGGGGTGSGRVADGSAPRWQPPRQTGPVAGPEAGPVPAPAGRGPGVAAGPGGGSRVPGRERPERGGAPGPSRSVPPPAGPGRRPAAGSPADAPHHHARPATGTRPDTAPHRPDATPPPAPAPHQHRAGPPHTTPAAPTRRTTDTHPADRARPTPPAAGAPHHHAKPATGTRPDATPPPAPAPHQHRAVRPGTGSRDTPTGGTERAAAPAGPPPEHRDGPRPVGGGAEPGGSMPNGSAPGGTGRPAAAESDPAGSGPRADLPTDDQSGAESARPRYRLPGMPGPGGTLGQAADASRASVRQASPGSSGPPAGPDTPDDADRAAGSPSGPGSPEGQDGRGEPVGPGGPGGSRRPGRSAPDGAGSSAARGAGSAVAEDPAAVTGDGGGAGPSAAGAAPVEPNPPSTAPQPRTAVPGQTDPRPPKAP